MELREYIAAQAADPDVHFHAVVVRESGRNIGNIKLGLIERWHRRGDVGIIIGDRDEWRRSYATEAMRVFTDAMFAREDLRPDFRTSRAQRRLDRRHLCRSAGCGAA